MKSYSETGSNEGKEELVQTLVADNAISAELEISSCGKVTFDDVSLGEQNSSN